MKNTDDLGSCIDELYELRTERLAKQKEVEDLRSEERRIQHQILMQLNEVGLQKATGAVATVSHQSVAVPEVHDWDEFYEFVHTHKYYHLLQRRVSVPAFNEAHELHNGVPGVDQITISKISLTKAAK